RPPACATGKSGLHCRPPPVDFCGSRLAIGAATERARALAMPAGTRKTRGFAPRAERRNWAPILPRGRSLARRPLATLTLASETTFNPCVPTDRRPEGRRELPQTGDIPGFFLSSGQKQLTARRHHRLSTALPFPRLDWSDEDCVEASLNRLHGYAIDLVNSAIDWYFRRIFRDRSWSWFFRGLSYLCAVVGAVLPLIKIFGPHLDKDLGPRLADPGGITAEFALVLIALAAALNVIDRLAGFSQSWIRARAVVNQLDQARIRFELEWNDLLMRKASLRQDRSDILAGE